MATHLVTRTKDTLPCIRALLHYSKGCQSTSKSSPVLTRGLASTGRFGSNSAPRAPKAFEYSLVPRVPEAQNDSSTEYRVPKDATMEYSLAPTRVTQG